MSFLDSIMDIDSDFNRDGTHERDRDYDEEDELDDEYSPTSWERHPWENDEDYRDRMEGQISMMGGDWLDTLQFYKL